MAIADGVEDGVEATGVVDGLFVPDYWLVVTAACVLGDILVLGGEFGFVVGRGGEDYDEGMGWTWG